VMGSKVLYVTGGGDEDEDEDEVDSPKFRSSRRRMDDDKSHMSELTEDRTQRHLDMVYNESPRFGRRGPPAFVGDSSPVPPRHPKDSISVQSGRLSVAQRARMEADRQSTPVRARLTKEQLEQQQEQKRNKTNLFQRMGEVLAGPCSDDDSSVHSTRVTDYTDNSVDEKKETLSLAERSVLQRQQQLEFLRKQGLIKDESQVPLGAGASDVSSHASNSTSPMSRNRS